MSVAAPRVAALVWLDIDQRRRSMKTACTGSAFLGAAATLGCFASDRAAKERAPRNGGPGKPPVTNPPSRPVTAPRSPVWIRKTGGADKPHLETHVELSHPPTTATLI